MEKQKKHYGLGTAISMIVGICIGSGIFFKADEILGYTGGNIGLSVFVFFIGAFCVVFGNITLSQLASRTDRAGGIITYFEEFVSPRAANAFGWFQVFAYYPSIIVVVSWVAGIYTTMMFGITNTLENQIMIGTGYLIFFHILNYYSLRVGGAFQNLSTIMKIIPLLGIGIASFFWKQPLPVTTEQLVVPVNELGWGWLAALVPMAFSFDGWVASTSITHEVRNAKRTLPLALTLGPLIVLVVYLAYFLGITSLVGPEYILATGDSTIFEIGKMFFGPRGGFIMLIFILVAVLGVVNGLILGNVRLPQFLASREMFPNSKRVKVINPHTELSPYAALISALISIIWMIIHYFAMKSEILTGGDVSEIAVVFSYLSYVILYGKVIQMKNKGIIDSPILGILFPIFGIIGSAIIVIGGIISNPIYVPIFLIICMGISTAGYYYRKDI